MNIEEKIKQLEELLSQSQTENTSLRRQLSAKTAQCEKETKRANAAENRVASLSVRIVELNELLDEYKAHALEDILTGLYNRRFIVGQASRFENAQSSRWLCAIMIDLDYLKQVNDNFSHEEGDKYLAFFAKKLLEIDGENKIVARIGGDEFLILIVKDDEPSANAYGVMLQEILNEGFEYELTGRCIASAGHSLQELNGNFEFKKLLHRADVQMYRNKARNH